jgi:CelD/BcsL family acetyltransferase involved in cellulose biosynthesis
MARGAAAVLDPETMRGLLRRAGVRAGIDLFVFQNLPPVWDGEPNPLVLPCAKASPSCAPKALLPSNPETLFKQVGTSESRRKLRRKEVGLSALGDLRYCLARTRAEVDAILAAFFVQKNERFRDLGIASPFDGDAAQRFIRATCLAGLEDGAPVIELHALVLDGRVIATYGGAVDRQRFSCMFNSFDQSPQVARFSPGDILLTHLIRSQCSLGRTVLDLGVGEARYKRLFCRDAEALVDVFVPVTTAGRLYRTAATRVAGAKRLVKQSPAMWSLVQGLRKQRARIESSSPVRAVSRFVAVLRNAAGAAVVAPEADVLLPMLAGL